MPLKKSFASTLICIASSLLAHSSSHVEGLYNSLDPHSLRQHLALYKLYPNDPAGEKALEDIKLLLKKSQADPEALLQLPTTLLSLDGFMTLLTGQKRQVPQLEDKYLGAIERLSAHLSNRKLKGYQAQSEEEVLGLQPEEIDIARALLLAQDGTQKPNLAWIRHYEAELDFMALQVLARLPQNATPKEKIQEINHLIFFEMGYRFPSLSALKNEAEPFSKLTDVLDSEKGVCLGISILYLSLAQRLDLPLEIVIPPGHIFVRHQSENKTINIETTARGINYPSENYLDVNTKKLKGANLKEVIGFVFYNIAANYLTHDKDYPKAIKAYQRCLEYADKTPAAYELLGYAYALNDDRKMATKCFQYLKNLPNDETIASNYLDAYQEYLDHKIDKDALEAMIEHSDVDTHVGLKRKVTRLSNILKKHPHFKAGHFFLAQAYQALSQPQKAIEHLEIIHKESKAYPYVEFSLAQLYLSEYHFSKSWHHTLILEEILKKHEHRPKMYKEFKKVLSLYSIEP